MLLRSLGLGTSSPSYTLDVRNSADAVVQARTTTNASGNDAYFRASLAGANAGDAFVQFDIDSVGGYACGIDNRDSVKFKLTYGGAETPSSGTTVMTVDSSGNVGIGTSSPSVELDVRNDGANGIAEIGVRGGTNGAGSVQISGHGTTYGSTSFDLIQNSVGAYAYQRANLPLIFGTNNTERMRIDSSGRALVNLSGPVASSSAKLQVSATATTAALFNRTNDGDQITFHVNGGSSVGSIGAYSSRLFIGSGDTGIFFDPTTDDAVKPWNTSTNAGRDAAIDLGDSGTRFKDLYLSGGVRNVNSDGINFGTSSGEPNIVPVNNGSQVDGQGSIGTSSNRWKDLYLSGGVVFGTTGGSVSSKTLDDYEEGTFTPTVSSGITSPTYSVQNGRYTKIGNRVFYDLYLQTSGGTANSSHVILSGLPFSGVANTGSASIAFSNSGFRSTNDPTNFFISGTTLETYEATGSTLIGTELGAAAFDLRMSGTYMVA